MYLYNNYTIKLIGLLDCEKKHEIIINEHSLSNLYENDFCYIIKKDIDLSKYPFELRKSHIKKEITSNDIEFYTDEEIKLLFEEYMNIK